MIKSQKQPNIYQKIQYILTFNEKYKQNNQKYTKSSVTQSKPNYKNKINKNYKHTYKTSKISDFPPQIYILHLYITQIYCTNNDYLTILLPFENSTINPLYQYFYTIIITY